MQLGLSPLFQQLARAPELDYVLATVVATRGSSYRKAGAMMLLPPDAEPLGLVSGGCLEGDLAERANDVRATGKPQRVHYDLAGDNDALWGLGLGCGGEIDVLLERAHAQNRYAGLADVAEHWRVHRPCWLLKHVNPTNAQAPRTVPMTERLPAPFAHTTTPGRAAFAQDTLAIPVTPPWRVSVCGGGVDAIPLVALACTLQWTVTLIDHRPAYARPSRFDAAATVRVLDDPAVAFRDNPPDAIVIMSHNLHRDAGYLAAALASDARYIGLLGPVARRDEVCELAGVTADARVHGPAGLDVGATLPETIALSIVSHIQASLAGRGGGALA